MWQTDSQFKGWDGEGVEGAGSVLHQPSLTVFCVWQYLKDITFLDETMLGISSTVLMNKGVTLA